MHACTLCITGLECTEAARACRDVYMLLRTGAEVWSDAESLVVVSAGVAIHDDLLHVLQYDAANRAVE